MKTLVILSSVSGVGKTSTIIPAIVNRLGATEIGTGHVFKAYMGMCFERDIARELDYVPTGIEALIWFIKRGHYTQGLRAYERMKQSDRITGYQTCNFVEGLLRSTCPDQPSRQARLLCDILDQELYVTDCINIEEFMHLKEHFKDYRLIVVGLDCLNPVERSGANRSLIPARFMHVWFRYKIENLDKLLDPVIGRVKALHELNKSVITLPEAS
jgi:hypothetical protein